MKLNAYHRAVLAGWADGDFSHLAGRHEVLYEEIVDLGDPLLTFIMSELAEEQGCDCIEEAARRIEGGKDDLDVALELLHALADEMRSRVAAPMVEETAGEEVSS